MSSFDPDSFPECDAAFDFIGGGFGMGVVPGGSGVAFPVDDNVVVVGGTFPTARGGLVDRLEIFCAYRVEGEVLVPFDDDTLIAFGDHGSFPDCFWHLIVV